jgi:RecA-family ATPase
MRPEPSISMTITLELEEEQARRLLEVAQQLQLSPTDLAKAAVTDLISKPTEDFDRAAAHVLEKNRELYRRLS